MALGIKLTLGLVWGEVKVKGVGKGKGGCRLHRVGVEGFAGAEM